MFTTFSVTTSTHLHIGVTCPFPDTVRVAVAGEIDLSSSDLLRVRLLNALSALHPHHFEVDLTEVTFLDCSGITAFVALSLAAAKSGCELLIRNPQPGVRRILNLTGVGHFVARSDGEARPLHCRPSEPIRLLRLVVVP